MTDSTMPDGSNPDSGDSDEADETTQDDETTQADRVPSGAETQDKPGSPTSSAPLTDSTDGGLEGGDPGVEE
jgi:hypothetical protein